jgi:putative nucleotidyltransferase with HDIG domain
MRLSARASGLVRFVVIAMTLVFTAVALVLGHADEVEPIQLEEGQPAPVTYTATRQISVVDEIATEQAQNEAAAGVADIYTEDVQATNAVLESIQEFFSNAEATAEPLEIPEEDPGSITPTTIPPTTTTTTVPEETTTSEGDETATSEGEETTTSEGEETTTSEGEETTTSSSTTTTTTAPTTTTSTLPPPPPREFQISELRKLHPLLGTETITALVDILNDDFERVAIGEQALFRFVEEEALDLARDLLESGIRSTELEGVRTSLVTDPRELILLRTLPDAQRDDAEAAVADLVATSLQANFVRDDTATEAARQEAREEVTEETVAFIPGEAIVRAGDRITAVELEAIQELGLLTPSEEPPPLRPLAITGVLVAAMTLFYLWRMRPSYWRRTKFVALLGLLLVLAALAARIPELVTRDRVELGFLVPAALFGYLAASLFDARVALLAAVPVTTFVALATADPAMAIFAAGVMLAPIPLVSSVSTRFQLGLAVVVSAAIHVPLAGSLAWYFYGSDAVTLSMVFGGAAGLGSGIAALGMMPFLANVFGITTTQTLLDLTDRNHPALRLLEEQAPGTFNHSIMVGNLAGRAARSVEGNPLLAQAMAYYHDLGKTTSPRYFVENQFGVSNPHDRLPPEESASIIRTHVGEGLRLAREYRIPPDVAQGILTHHGTSLMRYFYHKALDLYGDDINPLDYRHRGRKPNTKEQVIVMLSDATEASVRAMVQNEDPTSDGLRKLVEQIIAEKVEDGQLEESDVTFGELTRIKETFVDSLISYYHTRIPYPGFPDGSGRAKPA